jgi:hypothetical protein
MVENEIDLILAVAPVVQAAAGVKRERSEGRGDQVLDQRSLLLGVIDGGKAALKCCVPDGSIDEVELPSSFLHRCLPAGVVRESEHENACSR